MKNARRTFAFVFFMLAAIVLGALVAHVCDGVKYLDWLSWGKKIGFESLGVNLYIIEFNIRLMLRVTISQIFTIPAGLIIFSKTCKNL